ncbi:MAG: vanadium-dependent haloperoxidase [Bacteroidetes bacterium]|nr:vanadium-dependent haloperoxidase [Bacteroidota bacterium]MBS1541816.1 vanadium-dependent haloperoxidase [Bacteroidota bacterium]
MNRLLILPLFLMIAFSCTKESGQYKSKVQNTEFLHQSMKEITDRIVHDIFSPPVASRIYAYASVAGYEAIIHQDKRFSSIAGQLRGLKPFPQPDTSKEYCFPLAATEAMLKVGRALVFSEEDLDKFYQQQMNLFKEAGVPDEVFTRSVAFGDSVAKHVLGWANQDNYKQTRTYPKYSIEKNPATWQPTPPAYMDAVEPHWNKIRTFVIDSASQFTPPPPTPFSSVKNSPFYKDADLVYQTGVHLTDEQRAIASFWDCNPFVMNVKGHVMFATKKISPGGHWVNITRVACTRSKLDMVQSAEAYMRVSLAVADAFICCWDEKYRSKLVRPETYIHDNIDPDWTPLLQTPPFPEYTSGHSIISAAAQIQLTGLLGNSYAFTDSTELEYGMPPRSFQSFKQASEEAAISRVYGGIHYMPACENGKQQGLDIGQFVWAHVNTRKK